MIIDITQEVFSSTVYPGDPAPERRIISSMEEGDPYNLTSLYMCAHNGTHVDAPFHFIRDGKTIDQLPLETFIGPCWVERHEGEVGGADARSILEKARMAFSEKRILIAGNATVTEDAASVFADAGLLLLGNESQTVGPEDDPMKVHKILLGAGCILLEGVVLTDAEEGAYTLHAAPINLGGSEGAPCRAYLVKKR